MSTTEKKYKFTQSITGIEAFVGVFEKKIQEIHDNIPVMVINTGDETYLFKQKFEKISTEKRSEIYLQTPRIVIDFDDAMLQPDQNTNPYTFFKYLFDNGIWEGQFRRQALTIPMSINLVSPNFVRAFEYYDMLASILSIDNVFTYNFLGNVHDAAFSAQTFSFEKSPNEQASTSRNYNVKAQMELVLQVYYPRYNTLKRLDTFDASSDKFQFQIETNDNNGDIHFSTLKPNNDDC